MTAAVTELRSNGGIQALMQSDLTQICISLEEIGGIFEISSKSFQCKAPSKVRGAVSVIPPGMEAHANGHKLRFFRQLMLQVGHEASVDLADDGIDAESALAPRLMFSQPRLLQLGQIIAGELEANHPIDPAYFDSLCATLIAGLACSKRNVSASYFALPPWKLRRVLDFVEDNLSGTIAIADQARVVGMSRSWFCRAFKASTGVAPHQWLLGTRIDRAKHLLLMRKQTLAEIALAVGFADQAHFTRAFRRAEGESPGAWQRARES
jgi:AraC-like DNA-binding protein